MEKLVSLAILCLGITSAGAQEWSRFRGPNGSGVSDAKTVPTEIRKEDFNWVIDLPGIGHSSPVLWGKKIFLTAADPKEQGKRSLVCIDASDGKVLWEFEDTFDPHGQHRFNDHASATPAVDAKHAYIGWTTGTELNVLAVDHSGKRVWKTNLGFYKENHGSSVSPVVHGDKVIVSKDDLNESAFIVALSTADGTEKWKLPRKSAKTSFATPLIFKPEGGDVQVIVPGATTALTGIDVATGKTVWEFKGEVPDGTRPVGSPILAGDIVFASTGNGGGRRGHFSVRPGAKDKKAEQAYEFDGVRIPYVPTAVSYKDMLFFVHDGGIATCVDAKTGKSHWDERVFANVFSSPICVDGRIYCGDMKGEMVVYKADKKFEKLSTYDFGEPINATPAVANGTLYVRTKTKLYSIGGAE